MKKLKLVIDRPCAEKWESFEKRGTNGFCTSCQKEVIDFTKMSDKEIKTYFSQATGEVCGRIRKNQQKEYLITRESRLNPFMGALIAASTLFLSITPAMSQKKDRVELSQPNKEQQSNIDQRTITGKVVDDTGEAIPGVNVVIKGTTNGVTTNLDGNYRITITGADILIFYYVGFETQEIEVGQRATLDVNLGGTTELGGMIMGGISSRWYTPRGIWQRIKRIF